MNPTTNHLGESVEICWNHQGKHTQNHNWTSMKSWLVHKKIHPKEVSQYGLAPKKKPCNVQPPLPFLFGGILFSQPNVLVMLNPGNVSGVENSGCAEGADRNQSGFTQLYHLQLLRAEAGRSFDVFIYKYYIYIYYIYIYISKNVNKHSIQYIDWI